ncbi:MAG: universal stress protein [Bacteroidetes bacterium]|nr:universal stress protein [Bacteroidota bacterium]
MKPTINNILAATDFSTTSNNVIDTAIEICKQHDAVLHLIHVAESRYILSDDKSGTLVSAIVKDINQEARDRLNEIYEAILRTHGIAVQVHMPEGIPFDEICKAACEMPIDLVVIGKSGTAGIKSHYPGSTAYNVTKYSVKPVLTIPADFSGAVFKNIFIPLRPGQDIKEKFTLLQPIFNNTVDTIQVGIFSLVKDEGKQEEVVDEHTDLFATLKEKNICCRTTFYQAKNIAAKVIEVSASLQPDLIVIHSALEYKWMQFCLSAFARQLVHQSPVPVLTFRSSINAEEKSKRAVTSFIRGAGVVQENPVAAVMPGGN